jgi:hypothetical protein
MSEIKTDKIKPVDAGSTTTLGDSGDTISTSSGTTLDIQGTYSGINTINWDTTAKTAAFTAETNRGYFVDTSSAAITVTLPASPIAGSFIGIKDYALTADTNNIIINGNGNKIQAATENASIKTEGGAVNLVYVDSTQGWLTFDAGQSSDVTAIEFVAATGGTVTTCGDFKIHTFTGPGTFCVSNAGSAAGSNTIDYLVVAGGGSGAGPGGVTGGGGAGGFRTASCSPVTVQGYPVTIGAGGTVAPSNARGGSGASSVFNSTTSAGGGGGGMNVPGATASTGGSGGGGGGDNLNTTGAAGNTPPVTPPQGNPGGNGGGPNLAAGGGGGAGATGSNNSSTNGGPGGNGSPWPGNSTTYAGGGGGTGLSGGSNGTGGTGGGGTGGTSAGTANTGGGGGGKRAGGSGVVIIKYKFQ